MVSSTFKNFITIFKKSDISIPYYGAGSKLAQQTFKYEKVLRTSCNFKYLKKIEMVSTEINTVEPIKYIQNVKVTIPYIRKMFDGDYFVEDDFGRFYKITNIYDEKNTKEVLELYLTQWTKDDKFISSIK